MRARFSPHATAVFAMGIFMLVGFAPLGVALMIIGAIMQSTYRARYLAFHGARRAKVLERQRQQRDIAVKSLR